MTLSHYDITMKHIILSFAALIAFTSCSTTTDNTPTTYQLPPEILEIPIGKQYGLRAAEIKLPTPEGEKIALSSLQGKLVLVDFWASWCTPCRKENPELVKLYNKYRDTEFVNGSGFEIYSVSLDRNKKAWLNAIEQDKLSWPAQVSDLVGARTQSALDYGIQVIPASFLLDKNGVIIGVNLRGEKLSQTIAELVAE